MKIKFPFFREKKQDNDELTPEEIEAIKKLKSKICVSKISEEEILQECIDCYIVVYPRVREQFRTIYFELDPISIRSAPKELSRKERELVRTVQTHICDPSVDLENIPSIVQWGYDVAVGCIRERA